MHLTRRLVARAHGVPALGRQVVEGGFGQNGTTGVAGAQKHDGHDVSSHVSLGNGEEVRSLHMAMRRQGSHSVWDDRRSIPR